MSLILDALKKSEQQRQREKAPSLQSIHQPAVSTARKTVQPWWWLAGVIVGCNVAFFGYWLWQQQTAAPIAQATPAATSTDEQAAMPVEPAPVPKPQMQSEFTRYSPHEKRAPSQPASSTAEQRIEEINELPDSVRNNLPAMTFSFHVYSETPEQRTIIINDRRVREGDEVSAGLKLQSITPDGVVLLFEQHRIHIGVLSGW